MGVLAEAFPMWLLRRGQIGTGVGKCIIGSEGGTGSTIARCSSLAGVARCVASSTGSGDSIGIEREPEETVISGRAVRETEALENIEWAGAFWEEEGRVMLV